MKSGNVSAVEGRRWVLRLAWRTRRLYIEYSLSYGVASAVVDGSTPDAEREQAFHDLNSGVLLILWSYGVAIEGVDIPRAKCCIMARPTSSLVVFIQAVGRVLRPWNDVTPIVLDHGGNMERHYSPIADREWTLEGNAAPKGEPNVYHVCLHCLAFVETTHPCPLCGIDAPSRIEREIEADESIRLEEIQEAEQTPEYVKEAFYRGMVNKCRRLGWALGAAFFAYKSAYKTAPPRWIIAFATEYLKNDAEYQQLRKAKAKDGDTAKTEIG